MSKEVKYNPGKLRPIIQIVARIIKDNPETADNIDYLITCLGQQVPEITDQTKCPNCKTSMKIVEYTADLHDALLILAMARKVRANQNKSMNFTEANKVHLPTLNVSSTTLKRGTKCDYLGLVKQPDTLRNTGYWVLTNWAWKALKGEAIPKSAYYWQGEMQGRSEETTTLSQMFKTHIDIVQKAIAHSRKVRTDYRAEIGDYEPAEWSNFYGVKDGVLF